MTKSITKMFVMIFIGFLFIMPQNILPQTQEQIKPATNIEDALKYPRTEFSMPGLYPSSVIQVNHSGCYNDKKINYDAVYQMIAEGIKNLTGEKNLNDAWKKFVNKNDRIGLKVNPIGGPQLSTSIEVTKAVIEQLKEAGVSSENIIIWDRREEQLIESGFTKENFPGILIIGTERIGDNGTMYDENGKLYSERMIDSSFYYWADCEEDYDAETIPYMVNSGKYSYFSKIVTQMVDKIINIPIFKNTGSSITLCLKNLAYGSITNTGRLHKLLWNETTAQVCAFPPLRDKVVLNIADGIVGCFNGGPGANPQFITNFNTILIGTDPVAVDRIGFEIITQKRIDEGIITEPAEKGKLFLNLSQELGLGTADLNKINLKKIDLK